MAPTIEEVRKKFSSALPVAMGKVDFSWEEEWDPEEGKDVFAWPGLDHPCRFCHLPNRNLNQDAACITCFDMRCLECGSYFDPKVPKTQNKHRHYCSKRGESRRFEYRKRLRAPLVKPGEGVLPHFVSVARIEKSKFVLCRTSNFGERGGESRTLFGTLKEAQKHFDELVAEHQAAGYKLLKSKEPCRVWKKR